MDATTLLVIMACILCCELFLGWYFERSKSMGCHEYIITLLKSGISLEKKRVFLYVSGPNYKVLDLNKAYKQEDEYHFGPNEFAEAFDKFTELTNVQ